MRRFRIGASALALTASVGLLTMMSAAPASAHTTQISGPYALTFGWANEPCYTGSQNAVQLFVHQGSLTGAGVDNIQGLTVQVTAAGVTGAPLQLNDAFDPDTGLGNPAEYDAPLVPTVVGAYTFHITGNINGTAVSATASSSDSTFDSAHDPTAIEFPNQPPTNATLAQSVTNLKAQVATAQSDVASARSSAKSAKVIAFVAIVVAVVLAGVAIVLGRRKAPGAP